MLILFRLKADKKQQIKATATTAHKTSKRHTYADLARLG